MQSQLPLNLAKWTSANCCGLDVSTENIWLHRQVLLVCATSSLGDGYQSMVFLHSLASTAFKAVVFKEGSADSTVLISGIHQALPKTSSPRPFLSRLCKPCWQGKKALCWMTCPLNFSAQQKFWRWLFSTTWWLYEISRHTKGSL